MKTAEFKAWLAAQGQAASSVSTRLSDAKRIESHYGDIDEAFASDGLDTVLAALAYSTSDRAAAKPNPTRLVIDGDIYNSLASYRSAVSAYRTFLTSTAEGLPTQAHRIRCFVLEAIIEPARRHGDATVEVVSGNIHRDMRLNNAMPAVCSALDSHKFADVAGVRLVRREGPANSSTVRFTFALQPGFDAAAMDRMRAVFLARFPDFTTFSTPGERFRTEEDGYKRRLISLAATAKEAGGTDEELGGAMLDVLTGLAGQKSDLLG